jgi:imidazolonepropionase-like amidohydrolase
MSTHAPTQPAPHSKTIVLRGGRIYEETSGLREATIVVEGGRVAAVLPREAEVEARPRDAREIDLRGHLVTPGLIDAHTHLCLNGEDGPAAYELQILKESVPFRAIRASAYARMAIDHGFTALRDVCTEGAGYADVALRDAIAAGFCEGPRILASGPGIGITGGYLPFNVAPGVGFPSGCSICDSPEAAQREVRQQVAYGVDWIKVFADWGYKDAGSSARRDRATFTRAELSAIVDEAARRGRKVAAHAMSDEGAKNAVASGVASLEHMGDLSRETLDQAAARGIFIVPTLSVLEHGVLSALDELTRDRYRRRLDKSIEALSRAIAAGVRIACGTDIGCYPHAEGSLSELRLLMQYGLSPGLALAAATSTAAALLDQPDLGAIAPGRAADLCAFPIADGAQGASHAVEAALTSGKPALVVLRGKVVRGPS